jgi:hypothetical protein
MAVPQRFPGVSPDFLQKITDQVPGLAGEFLQVRPFEFLGITVLNRPTAAKQQGSSAFAAASSVDRPSSYLMRSTRSR